MLKLEFTNQEINELKSKIHFTPMQERIINYRLDEFSIIKMSMLENCSVSTINREIKKIKRKIKKVI